MLSLAILFSVINVVMAVLGDRSLDAHFTVLTIASLIVTLLFVYLSPRARRSLNMISLAFFVGFLLIVVLRARDVLTG